MDEYEYRRGPVRRRNHRARAAAKRPTRRQVQLALSLAGGTTAKDKGVPFDDDFSFIGRS